jgi:tRNA A-37 threonylcarbamoyl transferase component Bud32
MLKSDPSFQFALTQWLAEHASDPSSVHFAEIEGQRCVIKLRRPTFADKILYGVHYVRAWLLSCLCWIALGERPPVSVLMRTTLSDEARKLEFFAQHGYRVPKVWRHTSDALVLEYVGQDLPYLIRIDTPAARLIWMDRAARDLAAFHLAGFVHGGAQLRNLMCEGDVLTRIDFEESIGEALSRPLGQAYDVYQMVSSMAGLRGEQFGSAERQDLSLRLLQTYLETNPDRLVRRSLKRISVAMNGVQRYLGWLFRHLPGRDVRGFLCVADALRLSLPDE